MDCDLSLCSTVSAAAAARPMKSQQAPCPPRVSGGPSGLLMDFLLGPVLPCGHDCLVGTSVGFELLPEPVAY